MTAANEGIGPKFKEYDCPFENRKRPQELSPAYDRDQWWQITAQTDYYALKAELADFLETYAIPWLME